MRKILLSNRYDAEAFDLLSSCVPDGFELAQLSEVTQEALLLAVPSADYLIASGRLRINDAVLGAAGKLKMVARTGVGLDAIDQHALAKHGVPLYANAGVNLESVAEYALLLILASLRNVVQADARTKSGEWPKRSLGVLTHELAGKHVFIVGLGNVGRKLIQLLGPFGCQVDGADYVRRGGLPANFFDADVVSLHCPLLSDTAHLIDAKTLAAMKKGCIIVNTARGGLIDESALADALRDGKVAYAALDVREREPAHGPGVFEGLNNVLLTPHIAGITAESFRSMMIGAMGNIAAFEAGELSSIESKKVMLA